MTADLITRLESADGPEVFQYDLVKYDENYPYFGLKGAPTPYPQHSNQRKGLDLYVSVVNFSTGEWCWKKLYENKRGLHFKHTGFSPMYLDSFTSEAVVMPFQWFPNLAAAALKARGV